MVSPRTGRSGSSLSALNGWPFPVQESRCQTHPVSPVRARPSSRTSATRSSATSSIAPRSAPQWRSGWTANSSSTCGAAVPTPRATGGLAAEHPGQRVLRLQGADQHVRASARRTRRDRPARAGGPVLAGIRPGRQSRTSPSPWCLGHRSGCDRRRAPACIGATPPTGTAYAPTGRRRAVVGAGHRAGLPHGHLRVHPRRGGPPRHRSHHRPVPAHRDRRADRRRRAHRPATRRASPLRGNGQQTEHPRRARRRRRARAIRISLDEHPMAGAVGRDGLRPRRRVGFPRTSPLALPPSSPPPTRTCRRWAWRRSTTRWRRRSCSAANTWNLCASRRADSTPTWCWVPASPTTAGVWATCSTSAALPDRTD